MEDLIVDLKIYGVGLLKAVCALHLIGGKQCGLCLVVFVGYYSLYYYC